MKRGRILNAELSRAIATMGHGDLFMVCDAGFPIPLDRWRIDLAVTRDVPDLYTVLDLVLAELSVERALYADLLQEYNQPLWQRLQAMFEGTGAELEAIPNERVVGELAHSAKVIVRTGAFNPWGNIGLICGTDPDDWFAIPGTVMPPAYRERRARMGRGG
ncbi:MAG TPA: D-ribose pyranase [Chloroflexota bacterium]|jgi:D-ribose pyranase|nr:D-ribose pyranase [Chloroflexota bacterium]